jgi:hypothetical protein
MKRKTLTHKIGAGEISFSINPEKGFLADGHE